LQEEAKDLEKWDGILSSIDKYFDGRKEIWTEALKGLYGLVIKDFGDTVAGELEELWQEATGKDIKPGKVKTFDPNKQNVLSWINENAAYRATLVLESRKAEANSVIMAGRSENITVDQISRRLRDFYTGRVNYNAMRMARTEVVGSSNYGSLESARESRLGQSGQLRKRWVSSRDIRVRDDHTLVDGQTRELDDMFMVAGHYMMYPGDPSAPAEQVIHCRCVKRFIPVVNR
jgi:uncharacterized protein with gpF-like domain